jgi:hypothetical protein
MGWDLPESPRQYDAQGRPLRHHHSSRGPGKHTVRGQAQPPRPNSTEADLVYYPSSALAAEHRPLLERALTALGVRPGK